MTTSGARHAPQEAEMYILFVIGVVVLGALVVLGAWSAPPAEPHEREGS